MRKQIVAVLADNETAARIAVAGNADFVGSGEHAAIVAVTPATFANIDKLEFDKVIFAFGEMTPIKRWIESKALKRVETHDLPNLTIVEGALQ